jgi:DNA-binding transcriptional ArsR family regulator
MRSNAEPERSRRKRTNSRRKPSSFAPTPTGSNVSPSDRADAMRPRTRGRLSLVTADPDFQGRVCATLAHSEGLSSHALAEHLGASQGRVRAALKRLEEAGKVVRTGATRRTRWFLAGEPEPEPVRTGVARLHVFTKTMDRRELEDRELAYTTEAPAVVGELPERDA